MMNEADDVLVKKFKGKTSYTDTFTDIYLPYLHKMRCQATQILCDAAMLHETSSQINLYSNVLYEEQML